MIEYKFEYDHNTDSKKLTPKELLEKFNDLGKEDWNLIHTHMDQHVRVYIFKKDTTHKSLIEKLSRFLEDQKGNFAVRLNI